MPSIWLCGGFGWLCPAFLHSAFCILPSLGGDRPRTSFAHSSLDPCRPGAVMECAGRAQRRRCFGSNCAKSRWKQTGGALRLPPHSPEGPWPNQQQLASYFGGCILTDMITTLSTKGQTVIPESIREQARLKTGDKLDVGYINGLVVLRKRVPLTRAQARALFLSGRELPAKTAEDKPRVQEAVAAVRKRRHAA